MKKIRAIIASIGLLVIPYVSYGQEAVELIDPLGERDVREIIGGVIRGALSVSGTLALLMFVYGGILWLTDMGRGDGVKKGKDILIWSTLGIILIAGAYVLTTALFNAILSGDVDG